MSSTESSPTRALAKVCLEQGYFLRAAGIYRALLQKEPGKKDLEEALLAVEEKIGNRGPLEDETHRERLVALVDCWAGLVLAARELETLGGVKAELKEKSRYQVLANSQ